MNKKIIFWILVLVIFAVVMSLIAPLKKNIEVEPEPIKVFVNNPTAKDELIKIRNNQTKEEPVVNITLTNFTDAGTENIQALKEEKRIELGNWSYHYHPNNSGCFAICNFDDCTIPINWCDINETIYLEGIINV